MQESDRGRGVDRVQHARVIGALGDSDREHRTQREERCHLREFYWRGRANWNLSQAGLDWRRCLLTANPWTAGSSCIAR